MREVVVLALLALLLSVVSLGVVFWFVVDAASAGLLKALVLSLDGLLLIVVGLSLSAVFGFTFLWLAAEAGLWEIVKTRLPRFARKQATGTGETTPEQKSPARS